MPIGKPEKNYPRVRAVGYCVVIPMVFVAGPVLGFVIGSWIDHGFKADPWGKVVLSLFGFAASAKQVFRLIQRASKNLESHE